MIIHYAGGYFANSLAIMSDAAHMLTDVAGFGISLFAIWLGSKKPSALLTFGWQRAGEIAKGVRTIATYVG